MEREVRVKERGDRNGGGFQQMFMSGDYQDWRTNWSHSFKLEADMFVWNARVCVYVNRPAFLKRNIVGFGMSWCWKVSVKITR